MPNHLANETSPYLLQHADNPIDWYPWSPEAIHRAAAEDKPIFLSIGYAACHWCHVMAHESFEDPNTARFLNENFICIKVDREERPDLDHIYMTAVQLLTGSGGWPMSVFLTPDLQPFYGGTYFPPVRRHGLPSFLEILRTINHLWRNERENLLRVADRLGDRLDEEASWHPSERSPYQLESLAEAVDNLEKGYDWQNGGWNAAPKFPQPLVIEFLLLQAERGNEKALRMAVHALQAMQRGGMHDLVGGGFHRYSTDEKWLVPHFEKMLYDNALLAQAYLHGWLITGEKSFRRTAESTLDFILREMTHPRGGFFSSLDADSEGEEGKFYLFSRDEIQSIIADEQDWFIFSATFFLPEEGNCSGRILLQYDAEISRAADQVNLSEADILASLQRSLTKLRTHREQRPRPMRDEKILTEWNAYTLAAFSEAARYLDRKDYLEAARKNAAFLLDQMLDGDRLLRSWRDGQAHLTAYLGDYAALIIALFELYQSDPDIQWFQAAWNLGRRMHAEYRDPKGGYFDTSAAEKDLPVRPKAIQDNATPSGNSLACRALLLAAAFNDRGDLRAQAETMLASLNFPAVRYPLAFAEWLCALDLLLGPQQQVVVISPEAATADEFIHHIWKKYRPRLIFTSGVLPLPDEAPEILRFRATLDHQPTAYVCQGFTCLAPTTRLEEFIHQLDEETPASHD